MIKVELIRVESGRPVYGVVDYLEGKPVVRFEGSNWLCLQFVTSMTSASPIAQA